MNKGHYEAETCCTAGYLCGHKPRTPEAAERCRAKAPQGRGYENCFSMATIVWCGTGPDPREDSTEPFEKQQY
jgi:hypothetical protein